MVRTWRNSERIRLNMLNKHIISIDEHMQWYRNIDFEHNSYLIFEYRNRPVGLVQFNNIDSDARICQWGFYLGETDVPCGAGILMGYLGIKCAFEVLKVSTVYAVVLRSNLRSQKYHEKLGFQIDDHFPINELGTGICDSILKYSLSKIRWDIVKKVLV